ncbi:MAG: hypothetical protein R3C59_07685 [Planctomycetaceae bacterium]
MFSQIKAEFLMWTLQVQSFMRGRLGHLEPIEYCIGATLLIAVGFVLLSGGRR